MCLSLHNDRPVVWGHRGCRSLAPENTLASLELAHAHRADGWELDVVLTRDGVPVLLHDLALLRTTDAASRAAFRADPPALPWRFTLAELRELDAGIFPRRMCGRKDAGRDGAFRGQPIPTLAGALARSRELGLWVNIEIKDVAAAMPAGLARTIVARTLDVVRAQGMEEMVVVSSFNHGYVAESKRGAPHVPVGFLTPHAWTGDPVATARALGADAWHPGHRRLTPQLVAAARGAGIAVTPYTVNEPERMRRLTEWGASGFVTDNPQDARAAGFVPLHP
ncbi:MAG: glycerophosphodiester phosphodiesterase [Desulfovibrio sp.]|nr:glycerophosphodiester phosphodiesterase [Desulfovibrio sp.]